LRSRSSLSVLVKAVRNTIRVEAMATKPMNAMKMSVVEKLDQVSMRLIELNLL